MKTIKFIALCICLLLGSYSAYAKNVTKQQLEHKRDSLIRVVKNLEVKIRNAQSLEEMNSYQEKMDSIYDEINYISGHIDAIRLAENKISGINGRRVEIQYDVVEKHMDIFQLEEKYLKFSPEQKVAETKKIIRHKKQLDIDINDYKQQKNETIKVANNNIRAITGIAPKIDGNTLKTKDSKTFIREIEETAQKRGQIISPDSIKKAALSYEVAKTSYKETEKKLKEAEIKRQNDENALNVLIKSCKPCEDEYNAEFNDQ